MFHISIFLFFNLILSISPISFPYIPNIFLQSNGYSKSNITIRFNLTCQQCLCNYLIEKNNINYLALNCFTNETCEFFNTFPTSYKLIPSSGTKLYFLQNIFPNMSTCCQPNFTEILIRLQSVIPKTINLSFSPGAFGYDENQPDEAVVIGMSSGDLYWFDPFNLTFIRSSSVWTTLNVVLYNGSLFTSNDPTPTIYVLDSQTMTPITNITYPNLSQTRKYMFLDDGNTMIATTQNNMSLSVFNVTSPTDYNFQELISFPYSGVHSLAKTNDTFFYASSWTSSTILSYSYINSTWNSTVFISPMTGISGSHITLDDCGRVWHVIYSYGLYVYNSSGSQIASWNITEGTDSIYDIIVLPNYILLLTQVNGKKILQYDPQIFCN